MKFNLKNIPFARPTLTDDERQAVHKVLSGHILTHGPETESFEEKFRDFVGGNAYCVAVSSCTAALHLAYFQLGIQPGDEVIVPAMTHVATAHAVELMGGKPIFVDCESATGNISPEKIEEKITGKTKAISLVHFLGIPCESDRINQLADSYSLPLIEDCALAIGAKFGDAHVGTMGDVGCFSFYPTKHMTTGDGGMFMTRHENIAKDISKIRAFGVDRSHGERSIPGIYDVPVLGLNYRMSEMQAAVGKVQVGKLKSIIEKRSQNFSRLKDMISIRNDVSVLDSTSDLSSNSHYCLTAVLKGQFSNSRNAIMAELNKNGVGTSVYYPHPVPRLQYYSSKYGYKQGDYPNAEEISDSSIALPVGPHISDDDVDYMGEVFNYIVNKRDS